MHVRGLLVTLLVVVLMLPGGLAAADHVQTFVAFDPAAAEFPEGVAVDKTGNIYASLTFRDQILKIDPSGTQINVLAQFAQGVAPGGLAVDADGTVYTAASGVKLGTFDPTDPQPLETDPALRGIYRVDPDGRMQRLPGSEAMLFPNDVTLDKRGNVYATDHIDGAVWRVPRRGSAELWVQDPLLEGVDAFGFGPVGANGIAFRHNRVIVANTERGRLVEIPVEPDGSAGTPAVLVEDDDLVGVDGIALDVHGRIYAATGVAHTVVRVAGDGSITTLATADHDLNQPSTLAFGSGRSKHQTLYVANFSALAPEPTPGILTIPVGQPGQPLP
jgi:sugar lactone lactonase YvrE